MDHVAFTIATCSYLAGATVWLRSLLARAPAVRAFIVVSDVNSDQLEEMVRSASREGLSVEGLRPILVGVDEIDLPHREAMFARYSTIELCTAIKPACFFTLHARFPGAVLHYFDPDILICGDLDELREFSATHSFTLMPHFSEATEDLHRLRTLDVLRAGLFNFGYLGVNFAVPETFAAMAWWMNRLEGDCRVALEEGIFVDQSWGALFACQPGAGIFLHPGYNVAYWNLHERFVEKENGTYRVNGETLHFFHFSGYSPLHPAELSLHQDRLLLPGLAALRGLCDEYSGMLKAAGFREWRVVANSLEGLRGGASEGRRMLGGKDILFQARLEAACEIKKLRWEVSWRTPHFLWLGTLWWILFAQSLVRLHFLNRRTDGKPPGLASRAARRRMLRDFGPIPRWLMISHFVYLFHRLRYSLRGRRSPARPAGRTFPVGSLSKKATEGRHVPALLAGYISSETGVGESARGVLRALGRVGLDVARVDLSTGFARQVDREFAKETGEDIRSADLGLLCVNADQVRNVLGSRSCQGFLRAPHRVGYWYWETECFPSRWRHCGQYFDEIWVATEFVRQSLLKAGLRRPVYVVRPALRAVGQNLPGRSHFGLPEGRPLCLVMLDAASVLARKNPQGSLEALQLVAEKWKTSGGLDVAIKVTNLRDADRARLEALADRNLRFHWIDRYIAREETLGLISSSDCLVSLHRSEGLGLGLLEAMQLRVPVVATDYSGNTDFLDSCTGWPIDFRLVPARAGDRPYFGSLWAEPDIHQAAWAVEEALGNSSGKVGRLDAAQAMVEVKFGLESAASGVRERLARAGFSGLLPQDMEKAALVVAG